MVFIPYWRYTGRVIEDVWYSGEHWQLPEDASGGVVVKLNGKEIHIGSSKTMHYLYSSLRAVSGPLNDQCS